MTADGMAPVATTVPRSTSRLRWWSVRIVRVLLLVYLGLGLVTYAFQTNLIFPGAATQGLRETQIRPGSNYQVLDLRAKDGTKIGAMYGGALKADGQPLLDSARHPSLLFFYGNGSCMAYSSDVFDHFRRMGVNVIVPDFQGYGMSGGKPSEAGCYAAADAAYDYLLTRAEVDPGQIIATGWSLGGAVAIDLASRRPIAGVATVSAFTNMAAMAHGALPWLPTSLLLHHHFDNLAKIRTLTCPIFLAHGTRDELVPPRMLDELAVAAQTRVRRFRVEGAGHNDVLDVSEGQLWSALEDFIRSIPAASSQNIPASSPINP